MGPISSAVPQHCNKGIYFNTHKTQPHLQTTSQPSWKAQLWQATYSRELHTLSVSSLGTQALILRTTQCSAGTEATSQPWALCKNGQKINPKSTQMAKGTAKEIHIFYAERTTIWKANVSWGNKAVILNRTLYQGSSRTIGNVVHRYLHHDL